MEFLTLIVVICVGIMVGQTRAHVRRVERKIDALLEDSNVDVESIACEQTKAMLAKGQRAKAIRIYRDWTGAAEADALRAINRLQSEA